MDIWMLGILFWQLLNKKTIHDDPFARQFPDNYNKTGWWKKYLGNNEDATLNKKLYNIVIEFMLSEIPYRGKSNEILENFTLVNKYYLKSNMS